MYNPSLITLFLCFLKIGCVSFGGFMSLVSMIETQVVEKRKWLTNEDMLDGVALASLLPGPMAVNTVAYVGYRLRGSVGAVVSAVAVLIPTVLLMLGMAELYFRFGSLPQVERVFVGILPAVAAIVLSVCLRMCKSSIKLPVQWLALALAVVVVAFIPAALKVYATFGMVFLYGLVSCLIFLFRKPRPASGAVSTDGLSDNALLEGDAARASRRTKLARYAGFLFLAAVVCLGVVPLPASRNGLVSLMTTFGSMSLTLFGGGYVFIPMIQEVVVERFGWLTSKEFIDGIALGQVTPGPILISAAFIGQKVAGVPGALLSTLAIFGPPAMLMVLLTGMLDRIRNSRIIQAVMKGVRIAVIGLIFKAFMNIFMMAWPDHSGGFSAYAMVVVVFLSSFVALFRYKVDVVWVIPVAGLVGYFMG